MIDAPSDPGRRLGETADASFSERWELRLSDGRTQCLLCPRHCRLAEGQPGFCRVRRNDNGHIICTAFDHSCGGVIDPIEKKPLYHFLPGSSIYSFGTAGCNLGCRFCQNWRLSRALVSIDFGSRSTAEQIAYDAAASDCPSVAFTYNDPVIYAEEAIRTARLCHARNLRTVAVTAGFIEPHPRATFFAAMDGANVDLKSFDDDFYARFCGARLAPVLDTLRFIRNETSVWLEVTTLLIPGLNDSTSEIDRASDWFADNLGADVPWHFSAFHPDYRLLDRPRTPLATLERAVSLAHAKGIRFVYTGNVPHLEGGVTRCPSCGELLIARSGFSVIRRTDIGGCCESCGCALPGVWR